MMVVFSVHRVASALMWLGVSGRHFLTCYLISVVPVLPVSCVHAHVRKRLACHVNLDLSGQYTVQLAAFSHTFSQETDSAVVVRGAHINELWALYDDVNSQLASRSLFSRHRRQLPKGYLRPSCSSDTERWLQAQNDEFGHRTTNAGAVRQDQAQNNETRAPNDGRRRPPNQSPTPFSEPLNRPAVSPTTLTPTTTSQNSSLMLITDTAAPLRRCFALGDIFLLSFCHNSFLVTLP